MAGNLRRVGSVGLVLALVVMLGAGTPPAAAEASATGVQPPAPGGTPGTQPDTEPTTATPASPAENEPAASASAAAATVSGAVTRNDGSPVAGAVVRACRTADTWFCAHEVQTDGNGSYTFPAMTPDSYTIHFAAPAESGLAARWFDGSAKRSGATPVVVTEGSVRDGVDAVLPPSVGSIAGRVTASDGSPLAYARVEAFGATDTWVGSYGSRTGLDGSFTLRDVADDTYRIRVTASIEAEVRAWSPSSVVVADGAAVSDVTITIPTGSIAGRVTGPDGAGTGATVSACLVDTGRCQRRDTRPDGTYAVSPVAPGTYRVEFAPPTGSALIREWYDDAATAEAATSVAVAGDSVVTGIDAQLRSRRLDLGGTVRREDGSPLAGVQVRACLPSNTWLCAAETTTGSDGSYGLYELPAGEYRVRFRPSPDSGVDTRWFDGALKRAEATPLVVAPGSTHERVDAVLPPLPMGSISGRVVASDGSPMAYARVIAFGPGDTWVGSHEVRTGPDGAYVLWSIPDGTYRIRVVGTVGYGSVSAWSPAPAVVIDAGSVAGIDVTVGTGTVTGRVTGPGGVPAPQVEVRTCLVDGACHVTTTDPDGTFLAGPLVPGTHRVEYRPADASGLIGEWYDDATTATAASPVAVAEGTVVAGIDGELAMRPVRIGGSVTREDGSPVAGATVTACRPTDTWWCPHRTATATDGTYRFFDVPAGAYQVQFRAPQDSGLAKRWFDGAPTRTTATLVTVPADSGREGIDGVLPALP